MRPPVQSVIAREKLTGYLLCPRDEHDKAGFLAIAGYTSEHANQLELDIRNQLLPLPATPSGGNSFGEKFIIRGHLTGPNGRSLAVLSVWMMEKATGLTKFITLYPDA